MSEGALRDDRPTKVSISSDIIGIRLELGDGASIRHKGIEPDRRQLGQVANAIVRPSPRRLKAAATRRA